MTDDVDSVRSKMSRQDWRDVEESEFVDIAESPIEGGSIAFVFEHEEIGLHGFRFKKVSATLEPVSFDRMEDDDD